MSQPIRGQGGHLDFWIGPKNANFVEDVEIFASIKFRLIPFSSYREVSNVWQYVARETILDFRIGPKTQTC